MAHINLLPWREEAQKAQQQEFFMILGGVAAIVLIITLVIGQFFQLRVDGQQAKNTFLDNEIKKLDVRISEIRGLKERKKQLSNRISVVQQLQRSRNVGTQVLDEITRIVPGGIYLTSLTKQGNMLELIGKSESNNHLANMIREIERSELLTDAQISSISNDESRNKLLSNFQMRVRIVGLINLDETNEKEGNK